VKRWSVDGKATVKIGDLSRGGQTRGDHRALDHDLDWQETYTPCGIVDEDTDFSVPSSQTGIMRVSALYPMKAMCSQRVISFPHPRPFFAC
jgi:hypothetical protein